MSKNAEGWIRHRAGRKCPVEAGVKVDYRMRSKKEAYGEIAGLLDWGLDEECPASDIMAYKLHKPSEQVEACSKPEIKVTHIDHEAGIIHAESASSSCGNLKAEWHEAKLDGPLQWRDRITTIDFDIKDMTTERAELVQKLASEGFALIGRVVEPVEDMSDWRNWKEGDRIEVISKGFDGRDIGEMLTVDGLDNDDANQPVGVMGDDKTHSWPIVSRGHFLCIKWHSRASA